MLMMSMVNQIYRIVCMSSEDSKVKLVMRAAINKIRAFAIAKILN